jgi:hypothetical protein
MFEVMALFAHKGECVARLATGPLTAIPKQKLLNCDLHYGHNLSYVQNEN